MDEKVEEIKAVRMRYCGVHMGGWVGGGGSYLGKGDVLDLWRVGGRGWVGG